MPVAASEPQREMYCAEEINIPVTFPNILKCYAKAAIRTQPYDLLRWTSAYFRALANGELPPVKERLEYPPYIHPSGITPHFLKILLNQFAYDKENEKICETTERTSTSMRVTLESLLKRWRGMALTDSSLYQILMTGQLLELPEPSEDCDLYRFLAVACGLLGNNLFETMIYVCELLTKEPDGGSAMIPIKIFMNLYQYLADLNCSAGKSIIRMGTSNSSDSCVSDKDISKQDVEIEDLIGVVEVRRCEEDDEESACSDMSRIDVEPCNSRETEKACGAIAGRSRSDRMSKSIHGRVGDEKRSESQVPEGTVVKVGGGSSEVTRVQEERRQRRRDDEMHSRTKVVVDETTAEPLPKSLHSHAGSSTSTSSSWSASSLAKSHVVAGEGTKAGLGASAANASHPSTSQTVVQQTQDTDKILATRSTELPEEVGAASQHVADVPESGSITAQNGSVHREKSVKKIRKKNRDKSAKNRETMKKMTKEEKEISRKSFENDETSRNDVQVGTTEKSNWTDNDDEEESQDIKLGEAEDSVDYVDEESYDETSTDEKEEDFEDMEKYEPMVLENILEGMCECLEPTKETSGAEECPVLGEQPLDPVVEFIQRMRATGPYVQPEVPGIGPPVSSERVTAVGLWLAECARRQEGQVGPRNLRHFLCPNLDEKPPTEDYYKTKTMCP